MTRLTRRIRRLGGRAIAPTYAPGPKARVLRVIARSRILTTAYFFVRGSYAREQQAMLHGMARYFESEADAGDVPVYRIRRDVHRIEKGLASADRRPVFAEGYVDELVDAVDRLASWCDVPGNDADRDTLAWAVDVLDDYFLTVEHTPSIGAAARRYRAMVERRRTVPGDRRPQFRPSDPPAVSIEDLTALTERRRSVRAFLDKSVPQELIDQAVHVAAQSPSACNRQAFEFRFYDDPDLAERVAEIAPGFDLAGRPVPVMGAIVGKYRAYYRERDMHVVYIDASLAAMSFVLAAETLGLASCCINWPSLPKLDRRLGEELRLDPDEEVVMLLAVGYADPTVGSPFSQKAPLDVIRSYNRR